MRFIDLIQRQIGFYLLAVGQLSNEVLKRKPFLPSRHSRGQSFVKFQVLDAHLEVRTAGCGNLFHVWTDQ